MAYDSGSLQPEDDPQCFIYIIEVGDAEDSALGSQQATFDHLQPSGPDDGRAQQAGLLPVPQYHVAQARG